MRFRWTRADRVVVVVGWVLLGWAGPAGKYVAPSVASPRVEASRRLPRVVDRVVVRRVVVPRVVASGRSHRGMSGSQIRRAMRSRLREFVPAQYAVHTGEWPQGLDWELPVRIEWRPEYGVSPPVFRLQVFFIDRSDRNIEYAWVGQAWMRRGRCKPRTTYMDPPGTRPFSSFHRSMAMLHHWWCVDSAEMVGRGRVARLRLRLR